MLPTIILGFALLFTLISITHTLTNTLAAICNALNKKQWNINLIPSLVFGCIAITFWCIFYYLTN